MPQAREYLPDDRELRDSADSEFRQRQKLHKANNNYYVGNHAKPLKVSTSYDPNVIINLCRQAVDRTIAFLVPEFPELQVGEERDDTSPEEDYLGAAWAQYGTNPVVFLRLIAQQGAIDGHVFVKMLPLVTGEVFPRLLILDSGKIIKFWSADDKSKVLWYEQRWSEGSTEMRQDIVNRGSFWEFIEYRNKGGGWDRGASVRWNYALSPVIDWQHLPVNDDIYGNHELQHAELNDKVNKIASDINQIIRFHASPRTIGIGFEANDLQATGIDEFWTIPNENAQVFNLEMQSDLVASMNFLEMLSDTFFRLSRVKAPSKVATAKTAYETRLEYTDMLAKNDTLVGQYGAGLTEISKRLLLVKGLSPEVEIKWNWGNPMPTDRNAEIAQVQTMMNMGILSKETAASMLGIDWAQEQTRKADEATQAIDTFMQAGEFMGAGQFGQNGRVAVGQPTQ